MTPAQTPRPPSETELVVERLLDAPRAKVWDAWTKPELLARWFFPEGCTLESPSFDVREGGAYACDFRASDGSVFRLRGVFETLTPPERLVFTHGWADENGFVERHPRVTVDLEALGDKTRVTVRQTGLADRASRDSHLEGWTQAIGHLATLLDAA